jgi:hypothetical protein
MKSVFSFRRVTSALFAALLWILAGTACVTTTGSGTGDYLVTSVDGRVYRTSGEPVLNPKTGYYQFRDRDGRDHVLRHREVAKIEPDAE